MDQAVITALAASLDAGRLVVLCGAGLSMAAPTKAPSAVDVSRICFDRYLVIDPALPPALRDNLEALADHFAAAHQLESILIDRLVPWDAFLGMPNPGHAAIADLLLVKALSAAISTNYDTRIEQSGEKCSAVLQGALNGAEANIHSHNHAPLIKIHGCCIRMQRSTIWTRTQLNDPAIRARVQDCGTWFAANLNGRDLLVVGFWSDWAYLNEVIGLALGGLAPQSVTVVDPSNVQTLETKAQALWDVAHAQGVTFTHVQESGADALDQLRVAFSKIWLRKMLAIGRPAFEAAGGAYSAALGDAPDLDSESLYSWRKDAEGAGTNHPARRRAPDANWHIVGFVHLRLREAGAMPIPEGYELDGVKVRVINGLGRFLTAMKADFVLPPAAGLIDRVICIGAADLPVAANVIRSGKEGHLFRTEAAGNWQTDVVALQELLN